MLVYYNGQFLQKSQVAISPDDRGFLFADGVYEVIRSYRGHLFREAEHFARLARGLSELRIEGVAAGDLARVAAELLKETSLEKLDATVYAQITRGAAPRSHRFPPASTPPTVYVEAKAYAPPLEAQQNGAAAILVPDQRWSRCDLKTIGLLPNILAHQRAYEQGAIEAIFSRDGLLQEGTRSSILFVKAGTLVFPLQTNNILPSITREVIQSLAIAEEIPDETRSCRESELARFDEVIMASTGVEIIPITSVNGRKIGSGYPGPITRKLQALFQNLTRASSGERPAVGRP